MNIVLMGPQGCGKGTQAEKLVSEYGLIRFEAGSFLREVAKTRPDVDEMVNKKGVLVPDELTNQLVTEYLTSENRFDNIVFDGFPRTPLQYSLLRDFLRSHNNDIDFVFVINISEEETIKRLSARRMDPETGRIYNLITNPPGPELDHSKLIHREDDTEPIIKKRLANYHATTEKALEMMNADGILHTIDGERPIEDIYADIKAVIASKE